MKTGVLLLHGLTGVPSEMRPVQKYLQKLGFDTEAPALAGHDSTNEELLAARWQDWIISAETALETLLSRCDQVVLCGLSMGASICGILASKGDPRVKGLIMMSPTLEYDSPSLDNDIYLKVCKSRAVRVALHRVCNVFPIIGRKLYWTESPPYGLKDVRLQRQITKAIEAAERGEDTKFGLFRTYFASLREMYSATWEFQAKASKVNVPILLISSLEDTLVSIDNATNTFNLLSGTANKSMAMLTGCDHVLTLDLQRNYVCRLIGEFMEMVTGKLSAPPSEATGELSVEVYNRLNPLSDADWKRLVPGNRATTDVVPLMQRIGIHESNCYTIVVRAQNEPVLMLPTFIMDQDVVAFGRKQKACVITFAFPEQYFDSNPTDHDSVVMKRAWAEARRALEAMSRSYKAKITAFVENDLQSTRAGSPECVSTHARMQRNTTVIELPQPKALPSELDNIVPVELSKK